MNAFPFRDYGTLDGVLAPPSPDATPEKTDHEALGPVTMARISLPGDHLPYGPRTLRVGSDRSCARQRAVQAEIKTANLHQTDRRVIQYLLSPCPRRMDEAGRER